MALNKLGLGFHFSAKNDASGPIRQLKGDLGGLEQKVADTAQRFQNAFGEIENLGRKLQGAGLAIGAGLGQAVKASTEFGSALAEISTVTDDAAFSADKLQALTMRLASTYGGTAVSQAKALYQTISAGVDDATKATELLEVANKFAIGGMTDAFTAVDVLTSVTAAYSAQNLTAAAATDSLFKAVQLGKTTAEELAGVLGRVAPTANALGMKFDELTASIATTTVMGINTAESVTGLKAALANIITPAHAAQQEAARLGIKFTAAEMRSKGFKKFLDQITSSAKFNKDSLSKLFGSVEALNTVTALTANGGKDFQKSLDAMKGKAGATEAAFLKMSNTTEFQNKRFEALKSNTMILIGQAIEPLRLKTTKMAADILQAFNNLPKPMRDMLVRAVALTGAGLTFAGTLLIIIGSVGKLVTALNSAGFTVGVLGSALGPIVAIAAALGLAFAGLKIAVEKDVGGIGKFIDKTFGSIKLAFRGLGQLFSQGGFSGDVQKEMKKAENQGIKGFAINVFLWFNRIKNFFQGLKQGFTEAINAMGPSFEAFIRSVTRLASAFGILGDKGQPDENRSKWEKFGTIGAKVGTALAKVFDLLVQVVTVLTDYWGGFTRGFIFAAATARFLWNGIKDLVAVFDPLFEAFVKVGIGAGDSTSVWSQFGTVVGFVAQLVAGALGVGLNRAVTLLNSMLTPIRMLIGWLVNLGVIFDGVVTMIGGIIEGNWADVWEGMKTVVYGVVSTIIDTVLTMVSAIAKAMDQTGKLVGKNFGAAAAVEKLRGDIKGSLATTLNFQGTKADQEKRQLELAGLKKNPAQPVQPVYGPPTQAQAAAAKAGGLGAATTAAGAPKPGVLASQAAQKPTMATLDPALLNALKPPPPGPPPVVQATFVCDGEVFAKIAAKAKLATDARAFNPTTVPG